MVEPDDPDSITGGVVVQGATEGEARVAVEDENEDADPDNITVGFSILG